MPFRLQLADCLSVLVLTELEIEEPNQIEGGGTIGIESTPAVLKVTREEMDRTDTKVFSTAEVVHSLDSKSPRKIETRLRESTQRNDPL